MHSVCVCSSYKLCSEQFIIGILHGCFFIVGANNKTDSRRVYVQCMLSHILMIFGVSYLFFLTPLFQLFSFLFFTGMKWVGSHDPMLIAFIFCLSLSIHAQRNCSRCCWWRIVVAISEHKFPYKINDENWTQTKCMCACMHACVCVCSMLDPNEN